MCGMGGLWDMGVVLATSLHLSCSTWDRNESTDCGAGLFFGVSGILVDPSLPCYSHFPKPQKVRSNGGNSLIEPMFCKVTSQSAVAELGGHFLQPPNPWEGVHLQTNPKRQREAINVTPLRGSTRMVRRSEVAAPFGRSSRDRLVVGLQPPTF